MEDIRIACLSEEDIQTIRDIEKKLGDEYCLVAVEKKNVLYVLEAKLGPTHWERVDHVYPDIDQLRAYYNDYNAAKDSKSALKRYLLGNKTNLPKKPIRIRQIVGSGG